MKTLTSTRLALGAVLTGCALNVSAVTISSTFDSDDEGWLIAGDATTANPTYVASGEYIQATDRVAGGVWYYSAPGKFLGDLSGAYGQSLNFDLYQTGSGSQFTADDVVLSGGGLTLTLDAGPNPLPLASWVSYSVLLDDSAGWMNGGAVASEQDLLTTLGALQSLRIRGEFISGSDTGRLDNVSVNVIPLPAAGWFFLSALAGLLASRLKK